MVLLMMEGFDNGHPPMNTTTNGNPTYPAGRKGGLAIRGTYSTSTFAASVSIPVSAVSSLIIGFAAVWNVQATPASATLIRLKEGSTDHLTVGLDANKHLRVVNGAGTLLGTSASAVDLTAYNYFEIKYTISDTVGSVEIRMNNETVISVSGVDTRNGGTGVVNTFFLTMGGSSSSPQPQYDLDDFYVADTTGSAPYNDFLGDVKVETLLPTGNGDSSAWLGSDGNSVDNYQLVDDTATADYVSASAVGTRDLYQLADLTDTASTNILATQTEMLAAKSDAGAIPGNLSVAAKGAAGGLSSGVVGTPAQVTTTFQWLQGPIRTTDPDGNGLTVARVNALQAGPEVT